MSQVIFFWFLLFIITLSALDVNVFPSTSCQISAICPTYTAKLIHVPKLAFDIFDKTEKYHKMGTPERFYLQTAAILHDVGKYIDINAYPVHSHNIILNQSIIGFSDRELSLIANIVRYQLDEIPDKNHDSYWNLQNGDRLIASKLAAIMKMALAMDISKRKKCNIKDIKQVLGELNFEIKSTENTALEKWSFERQADFFEEVMGIKPVFNEELK